MAQVTVSLNAPTGGITPLQRRSGSLLKTLGSSDERL